MRYGLPVFVVRSELQLNQLLGSNRSAVSALDQSRFDTFLSMIDTSRSFASTISQSTSSSSKILQLLRELST
jgi:hypothetical protein